MELDKELLVEWALDTNLHLSPQDDELFLAREEYIDIMLDIIDNYKTVEVKKKRF